MAAELERDLVAFYDRQRSLQRPIPARRVELRSEFAQLLHAERRSTVLDIGAGTGHDSVALRDAGLSVTAIDLSPVRVAACRALGIEAHVASLLSLPLPDASVEAGWTMSTLLHIPNTDVDRALDEVCRVLRPGAPLAVGVWAGADSEGPSPKDGRFFSFRSEATLRAVLTRHGTIERFEQWHDVEAGQDYHWSVLRLPGTPS